jgi:hypothetical protein
MQPCSSHAHAGCCWLLLLCCWLLLLAARARFFK